MLKSWLLLVANVLVLCAAFSQRIFKPDVHTYEERIPNTYYSSPIGERMELTYSAYPGVFAMNLIRNKKDVAALSMYTEADLVGEFQEYEVMVYGEEGCYAKQRSMEVDDDLRLNLRLPYNENVFYTDVVAIPNSNKAVVVRNDYTLFEVVGQGQEQVDYIVEEEGHRSFEHLLNKPTPNIRDPYSQIYLVEDYENARVYAISQLGGVSFASNISLSSASFSFTKEDFKPRDIIYDVHYSQLHEVIMVACGHEGVDIYDVKSGTARFLKTIDGATIGVYDGSINFVDADSNYDQTVLYILDFERGLYFISVADLNNIYPLDMHIVITKARFFSHFGNTFMVVAETVTMQDYVVEVFVDLQQNTYFYNRFYVDEMSVNDVVVFSQFAVLIGQDAHKVVYHSTYSGFIDTQLEEHTYFQEPDLLKVIKMRFATRSHRDELLLVGLGRREFKLFQFYSHRPAIQCYSDHPIGNSTYFLQMNSTSCNNKDKQADNSHFSACHITHAFFFNAYDLQAQSLSDKIKSYGFYAYGLLFCIAWLLIIGCICYKRWGRTLNFLRWKTDKLKKQEQYDDFNDGPANSSAITERGIELGTK